MKLLSFILLSLLITIITSTTAAQTCESLFNTSVLSRFTTTDQETLNTLARRQVELSFNFSISKAQKDAALGHLAEQLENFIDDSRLTAQQEQTLRQEYRALVFQFKKELSGEIDSQTRIAAEKQKAIDQQAQDFPIIKSLIEKYRVDDDNGLLHAIVRSNFNTEGINDLNLALSIKGIDVNGLDKNKSGPIHVATWYGDFFLKTLTKRPELDVNLKDKLGFTALEKIINQNVRDKQKSISSAKLIISHSSFDPNIIGRYKESYLEAATRLHEREIALTVASHPKFDVFRINTSGQTPLHLSTAHRQIIKLLISKGADIEARDNLGNTPLHLAAERGAVSVYSLLKAGADINAKNNIGLTALHLAVSNENVDAVMSLIYEKGINVNIRDDTNRTPLAVALSGDSTSANNIKIIELLESEGAIH